MRGFFNDAPGFEDQFRHEVLLFLHSDLPGQ